MTTFKELPEKIQTLLNEGMVAITDNNDQKFEICLADSKTGYHSILIAQRLDNGQLTICWSANLQTE